MAGISKRVSGSWVSGDYGIMKTATDTITTLPAVIYPNASTVTVGLKGNTVQNGTPTPQNPVDVNGTAEKSGNLFDWTGNLIVVQGTVTTNQDVISSVIDVRNINTLYFTGDVSLMNSGVYRLAKSNSIIVSGSTVDSYSSTFIGGAYDVSDCNYLLVTASVYGKPTENMQLIKDTYMCNIGSSPQPYEPYGFKIPISMGGTTTPVYLGEVQTERQIRKLVLTGDEAFTKNDGQSTNYLYYANRGVILPSSIGKTPILCNELPVKNSVPQSEIGINTDNKFSVVYFNFGADVMNAQTSGNTVAGLKEYLASQYANGTPVTVWYVLATPQTAIVNEPLMKIGNYADSLTTSIPCTAGENTLDVQTTVQPSEVTANYQGWHPVQSVHERENGQWD